MNIEITGITVISLGGTDDVLIHTTLPMGTWPWEGTATLNLQVSRNQGEQYVKDNFPGVPCKVIHTSLSVKSKQIDC